MSDNPLGSASQIAWGFESARGVPDLTSLYGLQIAAEGFSPKIGNDKNKNIHSYGHRLKDQRVKLDIGGNLERQPDVASIARLRAHFWGWAEITNPVTGVYQWVCRPEESGDTPAASYLDSIYMRRYLDDSYEERISDGRMDKTSIKIERNKIVDLSQSLLFGSATHLSEPAEVAVNAAYTGQLVFRGWGDETETRSLRLKATVAGALDGTAKVECTWQGTGTVTTNGTTAVTGSGTSFTTEYSAGDFIWITGESAAIEIASVDSDTAITLDSAASTSGASKLHWLNYGGTSRRIAVTAGVWYDVILPDGERYGADYPFARVQFMFTSGGVFTLDDEWKVALNRGKTTVSFVQKQPLTAVGLTLTLDGSEVEIEGLTLDITKPRMAYFTTGLASARRVIDNGDRDAVVKIKRMYLDRTFLRLARNGAKVAMVATMKGDRIGSTAYYEEWKITCPNLDFTKAGADGIKGPTAHDEEIEAMAYYDPDTGTAPVKEEFTNAVASLH